MKQSLTEMGKLLVQLGVELIEQGKNGEPPAPSRVVRRKATNEGIPVNPKANLAWALKQYRTKNNVTQKQIARALKIGDWQVSNAETEKSVPAATEAKLVAFLNTKGVAIDA